LSTSWRDLGAADAALERLRAELGTGAVVRAEAQDTHRPEKAGVWKELSAEGMSAAQEPRKNGKRDDKKSVADLPATVPTKSDVRRPVLMVSEPLPVTPMARRALDPPEAVEVSCDGEVPCEITWRGQRIAVTRAVGPERLSGDWWDDGYRRDYWRCESGVGEMVVFLDRADDAWRMQAWAD